jgi:mannose-6-phosphate isomerase-like protein (cupin superfamily)
MKPVSSLILALLLGGATIVRAVEGPPAAAPVPGTPAPGYTLENCVRPFDPARVNLTTVGYQFWFADAAFAHGNTVKLSVVGPHLATHPPHRHAEDEFFLVIAGTAEFFLDGRRQTAGALTLFYCPAWHEHGIRNVGDTELKYVVLKKYLGPVPPPAGDIQQVPGAARPPPAQ